MYTIEIGDLIDYEPNEEEVEYGQFKRCYGVIIWINPELYSKDSQKKKYEAMKNGEYPVKVFWFDSNSIETFDWIGFESLIQTGKYKHETADFTLLKDPV